MRQHVFAGEGVEDERLEAMAEYIETSFAEGDYEKARQGLASMIAAVVRMDPDPAEQIAIQIAPVLVRLTVASSVVHQQKLAASVLRRLHEHLQKDPDWDGSTIIDYVRDAADEFDHGMDPFEDVLKDAGN
jgi:hypothetical protein